MSCEKRPEFDDVVPDLRNTRLEIRYRGWTLRGFRDGDGKIDVSVYDDSFLGLLVAVFFGEVAVDRAVRFIDDEVNMRAETPLARTPRRPLIDLVIEACGGETEFVKLLLHRETEGIPAVSMEVVRMLVDLYVTTRAMEMVLHEAATEEEELLYGTQGRPAREG